MRLYKDCGDRAEIARQDLVDCQPLSNRPSMTLWAKYDAVSGRWDRTPVPIPRIGDCGDPPPESVPVRVEVRLASRDAGHHKSELRDARGCPLCRLLEPSISSPRLRRWRLAKCATGRPSDRSDSSGTSRLRPGRLFRTAPAGLDQLDVRDGCLCRCRLGNNRVQRANTAFRVSVEDHVLQTILQSAVPADQSEVTFQGTGINSPPAPPGGANPISVTLEWLDIDPTHHVGAPNTPLCTSNPATTPCVLYSETHQTRHRTLRRYRCECRNRRAWRLSLSRVTATALPDPDGSVPAAPNAIAPPAQLYLTVGIRNNLTFGKLTILRAGDPQANNSLVCRPRLHQRQDLPDVSIWVQTAVQHKYARNTRRIEPPRRVDVLVGYGQCPRARLQINGLTIYAHTPWRCLATEPGFRPGQISDGIAAATGNCVPGNNGCGNFHVLEPELLNWHLPQVSSGAVTPDQAFSTMPPVGARPTSDWSRCTSFRITRFAAAPATTQFRFSTSPTSTSQGGLGRAITRIPATGPTPFPQRPLTGRTITPTGWLVARSATSYRRHRHRTCPSTGHRTVCPDNCASARPCSCVRPQIYE